MSQKTDTELTTEAQVIRDETTAGANSASRVYTMLKDIIDSKVNNDQLPKEYKALVTQTSTSAPTATVYKNSLSGTPTWARTATGTYTLTLTGAFPSGKTFIPNADRVYQWSGTDWLFVSIRRTNDNTITVTTYVGPNGSGVAGDGILATTDIEIIVYP